MLPPLSNKLIAHLDMNSYFASVEQQANPFLRGKPIGVCAYLHQSGCVIAASIEAKKLGMKVGMTVEEARCRVPSAEFVENDPAKYRAVTSRVFSILHELTDCVEHYSIDEAFLDLTGWYRDAAEAAWALTRVRQRIKSEVGEWLRCSIGIAPTRFLAKTASDFEKPEGLTVIDPDNLDEILSQLDLEDVCGIGPRIRRRLERAGIMTLMELKKYPVANLMRLFGKNGFFLWCKVNGMECEKVLSPQYLVRSPQPKSIGHSYCVPERVNRDGKVVAVLTRLTERAGRRMRREGLLAGRVSVAVNVLRPGSYVLGQGMRPSMRPTQDPGPRTQDFYSDFLHFSEPASDSFTLVGTACSLLQKIWHGERVNFLAVTLSDFSTPSLQKILPLKIRGTEGGYEINRRRLISDAVDLVRDRYGDEAIMFGSMMGISHEAPDRIGFRKTDGVDISKI
ncbi:DNA polymerase IV [Patescibacteria group bacterium]|nr:DNA polymerase IV [Patescibacteria group bacterium]